MDDSWHIASTYTRAQALRDGVLTDITELAKQAGFTLPAAATDTLLATVSEPDELVALLVRFLAKILVHGLLEASHVAIENVKGDSVFLDIGPGDSGEPVLTLMRPIDL